MTGLLLTSGRWLNLFWQKRGESLGLCCHPYDLCTELIARKSGVIITDQNGQPVNYPLNTTTDCSWIGYANKILYQNVEPALNQNH